MVIEERMKSCLFLRELQLHLSLGSGKKIGTQEKQVTSDIFPIRFQNLRVNIDYIYNEIAAVTVSGFRLVPPRRQTCWNDRMGSGHSHS